jgi:uncharacterized protein (TIRG00374 family)
MDRFRHFTTRIALPWSITIAALYFAFREVTWHELLVQLRGVRGWAVLLTVALTGLSYVLRAARWPLLFPSSRLSLLSSWRVLVMGFFMNNILPARAGEFVRAHIGGRVAGQPRTLVLATIASERLADGLTLSLLFVVAIVVLGPHQIDPTYAQNLLYVAYIFAAATCGVLGVLLVRQGLFRLADRVARRLDLRAATFVLKKAQVFIEGLSPLCDPHRAVRIALWSLLVWGIELAAFYSVSLAFGTPLSFAATVVFLVAVNFSSLVPAAPGGFGVIELVAKKVLLSVGVASAELALGMVLVQHLIQYLVVGVPGVLLLGSMRTQLAEIAREAENDDAAYSARTAPIAVAPLKGADLR